MSTHQARVRKSLRRLSTPDTIGVLIVCFYILNWVIYPEAMEYLDHSVVNVEQDFVSADNSILEKYLEDPEARVILGVIKVGIGSLKALILLVLLFASALFLYRVSRRRIITRLLIPLLAAFGSYTVYLLSFVWLLATYPAGAGQKILVGTFFYYTSAAIGSIVVITLCVVGSIELYRNRDKIWSRVNTSLHLFKDR